MLFVFFSIFSLTNYYKAFSVIVISINLNDMLCGIYLASIWMADLILKDRFLVEEELWRSGVMCYIAFETTLVHHFGSTCFDFPFPILIDDCDISNRYKV